MIAKTEKHQYYFEVQLNWQQGSKGIVTAHDVKDSIHVATPMAFAGEEPDMWSPEHLFLSSLSTCFMTTYLAFAKKRNLTITNFECNTIGQILLVEGHLAFTTINLFPKIFVEHEKDMVLANEVMIATYKHSLVANSIKPQLIHHGQVLLDKRHLIN